MLKQFAFCSVLIAAMFGLASSTGLAQNTIKKKEVKWSVAQNPANPYDELGLEHNTFLDKFVNSNSYKTMKASVAKTRKVDKADFLSRLVQFKKENPWNPIGTGPTFPEPEDLLKFMASRRPPSDLLSLNRAAPTSQFLSYVDAMIDEVKEIPKDRPLTSADFSGLIKLEATVSKDRSLSVGDKKSALIMASTIRYSLAYWIPVSRDLKSEWWLVTTTAGPLPKVDWSEVAVWSGIAGACTTPAGGAVMDIGSMAIQGYFGYIW